MISPGSKLFILVFSFVAVVRTYYLTLPGMRGARKLYHRIRYPKMREQIHRVLSEHQPYYLSLSDEEKRRFIERTSFIQLSKRFVGMEGFVVESIHSILLSSTIAQLTFGLRSYYDLPKFHLIQIYPESFYTKLFDQHAKGLTFSSGRILISWNHFQSGIATSDDKIHLGLHEFAHAMKIQFKGFKSNPHWKAWVAWAQFAMDETRNSESPFFRKYGVSNLHEFWAVSVETFFECPHQFYANFPELYKTTCKMLGQNLVEIERST